jgi:hypothetical protein
VVEGDAPAGTTQQGGYEMNAKRYAGIDLGQRFHQVAVVDGEGRSVVRSFRIGRGRRGVERLIEGCEADGEALAVSILDLR